MFPTRNPLSFQIKCLSQSMQHFLEIFSNGVSDMRTSQRFREDLLSGFLLGFLDQVSFY